MKPKPAIRTDAQMRAIHKAQHDMLNAFHRRNRATADLRKARADYKRLTADGI